MGCNMDANHTGPHSWESPATYLVRTLGPKMDSLIGALNALTAAMSPKK